MEKEYFVTAYKKKCPSPCDFSGTENEQCLYEENHPALIKAPYGVHTLPPVRSTCSTFICPIVEREPFARLSIGELTPEEKQEVEKRLALAEGIRSLYELHTVDVPNEGISHDLLIDRFDQDRKTNQSGTYVHDMQLYAETAERVRKVFRKSSEPLVSEQSTIAEPLKEIAKNLTFPQNEQEDGTWILASNIGTPSVGTLRNARAKSKEKIKIAAQGGSWLGRDGMGRIWWHFEKGSQSVLYLRRSLANTSSKTSKKKK